MVKYKYYQITGARINQKMFDDLCKRYTLTGNDVKCGSTTIAYRKEKPVCERDRVFVEGRY